MTRAPGNPTGVAAIFNTTCAVNTDAGEEWKPFNRGKGFLKFCSDISKITPTVIKMPANLAEVEKGLTSCDGRIQDTYVMRDQRELRDAVYRTRSEFCQWNFVTCVEKNAQHKQQISEEEEQDT